MTAGPSVRVPSGRDLARGGGLSFAGAMTSALLGFAFTVVLARMLGDAGAGVVLQVTGVFTVALAVCRLGLDSTSIWLLPRQQVSEPGRIRGTLTFMACVAGATSTVVALVVALAYRQGWVAADEGTRSAILAVVWLLPVASLFLIGVAALRALGDLKGYVVLDSLFMPALRLVLVAVTAAWLASRALVAAAWAMPFLLLLPLVALRLSRSTHPGDSWRALPSARTRSHIRGYATPRVVSAVLEQMMQWAGVLVTGALAGSALAGVYGSAARLIQAGMLVDAAIRMVVSPHFSRMLHVGDIGGTQRVYSMATRWLVVLGSSPLVVMAVFPQTVLGIFGPEFAVGADALTILCVATVVVFGAGNIHSVLLMSGHAGWAAVNKAVVVVLTVGGSWLLIPRLGIVGVALAYAAAQVTDVVLAAVQVRCLVGVRPAAGIIAGSWAIVGAAVLTPSIVIRTIWGGHVAAMAAAVGVSVLALVVVVYAFRRRLGLPADLLTRRRSASTR